MHISITEHIYFMRLDIQYAKFYIDDKKEDRMHSIYKFHCKIYF